DYYCQSFDRSLSGQLF
nr:immunoglobulin light chain junction region [Macaca mulatta]